MKCGCGYIYVRNHLSYDSYHGCKIGKTHNIPERDTHYATGEIERGYFELVLEVSMDKMDKIERLIQSEFSELQIKYNAGTEFYNREVINLIEPYLVKLEIKYRKLSKQEIHDLLRINRIKETIDKINIKSLIHALKPKNIPYTPKCYQKDIIEKSYSYFQQYNKGLLVIPCGTGKTLISLWITLKLNINTVLIGVPNITLLLQWKKLITYLEIPSLVVASGVDIVKIKSFLEKNSKKCIVLTTYSSAHKIWNATKDTGFVFGMKINDECHHLTTQNSEKGGKTYIYMIKINSMKQLSLTATLKIFENRNIINGTDNFISNHNKKYFGEIIEKKSLLWGIEKDIICDYVIQTIITNEEQLERQLIKFNIIEENDKRLFLSSFSSLESIFCGHSHHLLIYCNNKINSLKLVEYIKILLKNDYFDISDLYFSNYHSGMKPKEKTEIINSFRNSQFGIITCVYCLGEGWDFPLLDGVVFAENMTSDIRILQSALRPNRKNQNDQNKKAKIILPILNKNNWLGNHDDLTKNGINDGNHDDTDFRKIREVVYQMGLEDESIVQKIKVLKIRINTSKVSKESNVEFGEYDEELTQKLCLKTIKRLALGITYEKAKKIISDKGIDSKECYYELCDKDNRLSKEPEIVFKGQFTNWIDYLGIQRRYYDLDTCKEKIKHYLSLYPEIKKNHLDLSNICLQLCKIDKSFPPNGLWVEYYDLNDLQDIIYISQKKKTNIIL